MPKYIAGVRLLYRYASKEFLAFLGARNALFALMLAWLFLLPAYSATPRFSPVVPGQELVFPRDFGAHPDFRTEWWYATGWLETPEKTVLGFQITFFRSATDHDSANPSRFAPKQLIIGHAALSDPVHGKLLHDQKTAREGFGLAYAKEGNTDIKLDDWRMVRNQDGQYQISVAAREFTLTLSLSPTQPLMLQGKNGFFRKGPQLEHASYYYSEPQLQVKGTVQRGGQALSVNGTAWLDHEWFTTGLDADAVGWNWVGVNLDDGSALMAILIRRKDGGKLWAHAVLRDRSGRIKHFKPDEVEFLPIRFWRSPRTDAFYPIETRIKTGDIEWHVLPLQDDQELDARQSSGTVYWEGAITVMRNGKTVGRGYLEMTGYVKPLKL